MRRLTQIKISDRPTTSTTLTSYLDAKGTSSWSLKLPSMPAGRYSVWTRGIDAAGNVERKNRARNVLVVRVPTHRKA